jgi:uncharacterized UBP type Zn finger protein
MGVIKKALLNAPTDPTTDFDFLMQLRITCPTCKCVRTKSVPASGIQLPLTAKLSQAWPQWRAETIIEGFNCSQCKRPVDAIQCGFSLAS